MVQDQLSGLVDMSVPFVSLQHTSAVTRSDQHTEQNALSRIARTREGRDVIIRVIVVGSEGHEHLKILRKIATGEHSLYSNNHALPMFSEFQMDDIVFGFFPKVGTSMGDIYYFWARNSVGDIVYMLMQMLEVHSPFSLPVEYSLTPPHLGPCIYPRSKDCSSSKPRDKLYDQSTSLSDACRTHFVIISLLNGSQTRLLR